MVTALHGEDSSQDQCCYDSEDDGEVGAPETPGDAAFDGESEVVDGCGAGVENDAGGAEEVAEEDADYGLPGG